MILLTNQRKSEKTSKRPSRQENIITMFFHQLDEASVLMRLAAYHNHADQPMIPVRKVNVKAGTQVFVPHQVVSQLIAMMFFSMQTLWNDSQTESDDILIASYAMYLITAIHPFEDKNGHVAVDYGQYLLMNRWQVDTPPLYYSSDTHRILGKAFAPLDKKCAGSSNTDVQALYDHLFDELTTKTLATLWKTPNLIAVADYLAHTSGLTFQAKIAA